MSKPTHTLLALAAASLAVAGCVVMPDATSAQGSTAGESPEAMRQIALMGDINARINSPDVFHLPPHTAAPTVPASISGMRVLLADRVVGNVGSLETSAQSKAGCMKSGAGLVERMGWVPVFDASQPHDLVMRADCTASVAFTTASNGALFALIRQDVHPARFETTDGQLIDEISLIPLTLACPVVDETRCGEALLEYSAAHFIGAVATSPRIADFAAHHRPPGG